MASTISNIVTEGMNLSKLPEKIGIVIQTPAMDKPATVFAPALAVKPKLDDKTGLPTGPPSVWFTCTRKVPLTMKAEDLLAGITASFGTHPLKAGKKGVHTSDVNEKTGKGGNPTVTFTGIVPVGGDEVPFQIMVSCTALAKADGDKLQVWVRAFRRPTSTGDGGESGSVEGELLG